MKKVLLASVTAIVVGLTGNAAHAEMPKFQSFSNYTLECESMYQDRRHLVLEIKPSENTVTLHNDKGETFVFPVTQAQPSITNGRNRFGHDEVVPYVAYLEFNDNGGHTRMLMHRLASFLAGHYMAEDIIYIPKSPDKGWGYKCIPAV